MQALFFRIEVMESVSTTHRRRTDAGFDEFVALYRYILKNITKMSQRDVSVTFTFYDMFSTFSNMNPQLPGWNIV